MAIVKLQKVSIIGKTDDKAKILQALQNFEAVQLEEQTPMPSGNSDEGVNIFWTRSGKSEKDVELKRANVEFAVKFLASFAKKRGILEGPITVTEKKARSVTENFDYEEIVKLCQNLEIEYTNAKTTIELLGQAKTELTPWKNSKISPKASLSTKTYEVVFLIAPSVHWSEFENGIKEVCPLIDLDVVNEIGGNKYAILVFKKDYCGKIKELLAQAKIKEIALPNVQTTVKDALKNIEKQTGEAEKTVYDTESALKKLSANYETLQIVHDYLKWQVDVMNMAESAVESKMTFAYVGWLPIKQMIEIENVLRDKTNNKVAIIPMETDGQSPVALKNHPLLEPIENVTKLYGLPIPTEYDPTIFISIFFILFFGMAVTDAGYGVVMTIIMLLVLKYIKLGKQIRSFVKLLLYAGILTIVMGILYGSWFGMTIEQSPGFLTVGNGENMKFIGQIFNPIEDPMTVLILSLVLGYIQVSFGVLISFIGDFTRGSKKDAIIDKLSWFLTLVSLAVVIMSKAGLASDAIGTGALYFLYFCLIFLVATQGRAKPSIPGKIVSGILSLYGLVGYFGDILSYSRLLALGLATAIIGLAVNVVAGLVGGLPFIGWLLVIIVLVGGHTFNMVVNALGAFIHAARLQFVEFFSKFLVGGGKAFRPFRKESKFIMLEKLEQDGM